MNNCETTENKNRIKKDLAGPVLELLTNSAVGNNLGSLSVETSEEGRTRKSRDHFLQWPASHDRIIALPKTGNAIAAVNGSADTKEKHHDYFLRSGLKNMYGERVGIQVHHHNYNQIKDRNDHNLQGKNASECGRPDVHQVFMAQPKTGVEKKRKPSSGPGTKEFHDRKREPLLPTDRATIEMLDRDQQENRNPNQTPDPHRNHRNGKKQFAKKAAQGTQGSKKLVKALHSSDTEESESDDDVVQYSRLARPQARRRIGDHPEPESSKLDGPVFYQSG